MLMMLMMLMMLLMRLMHAVIRASHDPRVKSLLLRMLRGQTPQVRLLLLLLLLLLLPHVVLHKGDALFH